MIILEFSNRIQNNMEFYIIFKMIFYFLIVLILGQVKGIYDLQQLISYPSSYDFKVMVSANGSKLITGNTNRSMMIYKFVNS